MQDFHILIPAAGSGLRLGMDGDAGTPKQYRSLAGKPLLRHTLDALAGCPGLRSVTVVIAPAHRALYDRAVAGLVLNPPVTGASTRRESVARGLAALNLPDNARILVHDAARPFVTQEDVLKVVSALDTGASASLAAPVADTLRHTSGAVVDRDGLWGLQTPQGFHFGALKAAHAQANGQETDDTGIMDRAGIATQLVEGSRGNFKITHPSDWDMAERMIAGAQAREYRTGHGYDVHAFDDGALRPLVLGGVTIDHARSLKAHSDGDVILHALADAILGVAGEGDIGCLFPPSDPTWKNADSRIFVRAACDALARQQGQLHFIDITVIAEAPKIAPHADAMKNAIAACTGLAPARIAIKATTQEGLGAIGRGEGIAVHAHISASFPPEAA